MGDPPKVPRDLQTQTPHPKLLNEKPAGDPQAPELACKSRSGGNSSFDLGLLHGQRHQDDLLRGIHREGHEV